MTSNEMSAIAPDWGPLKAVAPDLLDDVMWMGRSRQDGTTIEQYKHIDTRRYLNLDASGQAWRFVGGAFEPVELAAAVAYARS